MYHDSLLHEQKISNISHYSKFLRMHFYPIFFSQALFGGHISPGPSDSLVVVFRVHGQDADPGPDVDQQQRIWVLQWIGLLGAMIGISGVF